MDKQVPNEIEIDPQRFNLDAEWATQERSFADAIVSFLRHSQHHSLILTSLAMATVIVVAGIDGDDTFILSLIVASIASIAALEIIRSRSDVKTEHQRAAQPSDAIANKSAIGSTSNES